MARNFNAKTGVVHGTVVHTPKRVQYFFVKPETGGKNIRCHLNQGGRLGMTNLGSLTLSDPGRMLPNCGDEITLIRRSQISTEEEYTMATAWTTRSDWNRYSWGMDIQKVYKVVGLNHRVNGVLKPAKNQTEALIVEGTLPKILCEYPDRLESGKDPLASGYSVKVGNVVLGYDVCWMVQTVCEDKVLWLECACPIPQHVFHPTIRSTPIHPQFAELELFAGRSAENNR